MKLTSATLSCVGYLCKSACSLSCSRNYQKLGACDGVFQGLQEEAKVHLGTVLQIVLNERCEVKQVSS